MIIMNREMAFLSQYVSDKEFFLPNQLRKAISDIFYQMSKRRIAPSLAIHIVNNIYKSKYGVEYGKQYLWEKYRARKAHIKNGKAAFKKWTIEKRMTASMPKVEKLCECGCGEPVKNANNRFIHGHHRRILSDEEKVQNAKHMREVRAAKAAKKKAKVIKLESYKNL